MTNLFRFSVVINGARQVFDAHRHAGETQLACQLRALNAFRAYWFNNHWPISGETAEWIA